ncbi:MAG: hypothetical protein HQM14_01850 [SAR324 cluster bacterium]|nr:hypothetical protein [SAR324 cluster bacterium]
MRNKTSWTQPLFFLLSLMIVTCSSDTSTTSEPPFTSWMSLSQFDSAVINEIQRNRYPAEIQSREIDGDVEYRALFLPYSDPFSFFVYPSLTEEEFNTISATLSEQGYILKDVELLAFSGSKTYTAVWTTANDLTNKAFIDTAVTSSTCSKKADSVGGILVQVDGSECVIMESNDRALCRSTDSYAECVNFSTAQSTCTGKNTPGANPYLPNREELGWMYIERESGSPVSSNNFCVEDSSPCSVSSAIPVNYWTSEASGGGSSYTFNFETGSEQVISNSTSASVRCVMRITP